MPVSISVPVMSWMIALLAFVVLVFFVFAMVLYLRRCISSVSQKYQDTADLSSAVAMLEADKNRLEQYLSEQQDTLKSLMAEREEQESVRQEILALEQKRKDLESAIEGLVAMQVEMRELKGRMEERRKELAEIESAVKEAQKMQTELPAVREEYERLKKALERKVEIEAAISAGEERVKRNDEELKKQQKELSDQQARFEELSGKMGPLKKKHDELQADCAALNGDIRSLLDQSAEVQAQVSALNTQLPVLQNQAREAERAESRASEHLEQLRDEQDDLEKQCRDLEKQQDAASRELSSMQTQLAGAKKEFTELNAQLPALRKQVQALGQQVSSGDPAKDEALQELMKEPVSLVLRQYADAASEQEKLQDFRSALRDAHLTFPDRTVKAFHTSLKCQDINPLTVLAGVSGTGKTLLPVKYAEFMGINQVILSVQPRWDSAQDLFGFYNYLERRYKATELSRCLLRMDPNSRYFTSSDDENARSGLLMVLLDEMNLARPEYYFSEFLSKLELRRTVSPADKDSRSRATIELDTGTGHEHFSIWVPDNILFVGTMNEDESTQTLSDKVLDRANVLRFGKPARHQDQKKPVMTSMDGGASLSKRVWNSWKTSEIQQYAGACGDWTRRLNDALAGIGRAFGFRVEEAMYSYVANYPGVRRGNDAMRMAFADQVEQKILPKLRGCDMTMNASASSLDTIEDVIRELDDEELMNAFQLSRRNASETGIFLWQGVTR